MLNLFHDRAVGRGVELGTYPLERLARKPDLSIPRLSDHAPELPPALPGLARAARKYADLFAACDPEQAETQAPGSADPARRAQELKGAAHYLDASMAGICAIDPSHWYAEPPAHTHALVMIIAHGRTVETDNLASGWLSEQAQAEISRMRAVEIGASLMGHIRRLGYAASCHFSGATEACLESLAVAAGVAQIDRKAIVGGNAATHAICGHAQITNPFLGRNFSLLAITTDYELATDAPLHPLARIPTLPYWLGLNGATSGRERRRQARRASHLSRYPMEQVPRVERPTTLIFDDEIPRVPRRAEFFARARAGDLGEKAREEVQRFAFKHPLTDGMMHPLRAMVAHQDGPLGDHDAAGLTDAAANTRAIKSLSYHLGADLTGICEIPRYAWYSHDARGEPIEMAHKYAVVMLIDQGYDTMEGASGDDWISGCQSMRGYIRGAEIAGIMAEHLRDNGVPSRAQTNADSQVLQIPLVLLAGLGELSRIGELVLNPYVGPRFKSVVLTTDLPLEPDQPIDFGLQDFCGHCKKCARECPVNAIPFGDKVMFNGYEIWKPDVERCTRYRVTNPRGSACGRCMKTCPLNKVVTADGALVHRLGTWLGVNARWLKPLLVPLAVKLDDVLGYGRRNPVKRWWQDLEIVNGKVVVPRGTNERDLEIDADVSGSKSPVGYYHAADNPPPRSDAPVPANHKQAVARAALLETIEGAQQRRARGEPPPAHYIPTRQLDA